MADFFKIKNVDDVVLIGYDKQNARLQIQTIAHIGGEEDKSKKKKKYANLRVKKKEQYEGKAGRKFAIAFYTLGENKIYVTDFFRGVLIDPHFYVRNLLSKNGILAIVADEFVLNEVWKSRKKKGTDAGTYGRLVEILNAFWKDVSPVLDQSSKDYFDKHVTK
jgi:hypothetical protein